MPWNYGGFGRFGWVQLGKVGGVKVVGLSIIYTQEKADVRSTRLPLIAWG